MSIYGVLIDHAWCLDDDGKLVDPTMVYEPSNRFGGYFGVPFRRDYLLKTLKKNGVYGLLGWPEAKTTRPLFEGKVKRFKTKLVEKVD